MTTHDETSHEHHALGRYIERIDTLTAQMTTPRTPQDLPSLASAPRTDRGPGATGPAHCLADPQEGRHRAR
ncbi:hypothetical protein [Streptomyces sp. SM14]|uniref:hypothetical protein n=1 Tax=Streptomyces sp. SM14 TaxID=1736045 RepID=UPI000CD4D307|nr:hypothetical protein [Streptomyces sp. SM14]